MCTYISINSFLTSPDGVLEQGIIVGMSNALSTELKKDNSK